MTTGKLKALDITVVEVKLSDNSVRAGVTEASFFHTVDARALML
ncbi:hypothetical protein OW492_00385 [Psychromonas sp. 14N.309.X.WAT.B.A12]|nr:hypothetical protein [Psychromonas sp. 14N.309.X.WAT.B.A12]MDN2661828.1 hypothetical protein [Psychromonas sp. 14N.309.X.WAT.B.A12]